MGMNRDVRQKTRNGGEKMERVSRKVKPVARFLTRGRHVGSAFLMVAVALALVWAVCPANGHAETLTLGHTVPPSHVWHQVAMRFAENVASASQDRMTVKVVPLQKLGNEPQMSAWRNPGHSVHHPAGGLCRQPGRVHAGLVSSLPF